MKLMPNLALTFLVMMLVVPVAQSNADLITFDFANGGDLDGQTAGATMSEMGSTDTVILTTLTISAPDFGVLPGGDPYTNLTTAGHETNIANNGGAGGLGVNNDTIGNADFNTETGAGSSESSNINYLESITIEFDQTVTMTNIDFASLGGTDEFLRINVEGVSMDYDFFNGTTNDIFSDPLNGLVITAGTNVTFTGLGGAGVTNLRIDEFTVATVPEPGSLALLGVGSLLVMVRRRRRV